MIVLHRSREHLKKRSRALAVERELPCRMDKVAASEEGQVRRVEELERALNMVREDLSSTWRHDQPDCLT